VSQRRALTFIVITVFLDFAGVGILIPVLPYLVRQFDQSALTVGVLAMSYSAAQFLVGPLLGALSDRVGRRPVLLVSVLGSALAYLAFGLARSLWVLFAARIIDGVTGANYTAAQAYVADITPPADRGKRFGLLGAALGVGFIVGPGLGALLSTISLQAPAFGAAAFSFAAALFGAFVLPESLAVRQTAAWKWAAINPLRLIGEAARRPGLRAVFVAVFAVGIALSSLRTNFAVLTAVKFHLGPGSTGAFLFYAGVISVIMQGGVLRRIAGRWPSRSIAAVGLCIMAAGFVGLAVAPAVWALWVALLFYGVGSALAMPMLTATISSAAPATEQGSVLGASQAVQSLSFIVGPLWAGRLFDVWGPAAPYSTGALWLLAALALVVA
jgi:DHA1 family tetracycline resistance protein-like MFS transporter